MDERAYDPLKSSDIRKIFLCPGGPSQKLRARESFHHHQRRPVQRLVLSTRFSRTQKTILSPKPPPPPPLRNACSRAPHCQLTDFTASDSVSTLLSCLLLPLSHVVPVNARARYKIPAMIHESPLVLSVNQYHQNYISTTINFYYFLFLF